MRPRLWTGSGPFDRKATAALGTAKDARRLRLWGYYALQVGLACLAAVRGVPASTRHACPAARVL